MYFGIAVCVPFIIENRIDNFIIIYTNYPPSNGREELSLFTLPSPPHVGMVLSIESLNNRD